MTEEKLIVYGAKCVWWDSIDKAGKIQGQSGHSLPCCPYCKGVLFQQSESDWWFAVQKFENEGHKGYREFIEWQRGKCFPKFEDLKRAYKTNNLILDLDVLKWLDT